MTEPTTPLSVALTVEQLWQPVPGGSGTYVRALVSALGERPEVRTTGIRARPGGETTVDPLPVALAASRLPRRYLYESWGRLRRPAVPRTAADRAAGRRYHVVHATTWAVPPRSAPLVVTVHDVAFLRTPEHFTAHGVAFFQRALDTVRRDADLVVVPSEVTRADCVDAGIDADRLRVVHHGTVPWTRSAADVAAFRSAHGLRRDFVLWCGTLEPRKNVGAVLGAFERLLAEGSDLDLVLVGPTGWGGTSDEVRRAVDALPADRVHVLGRLDDADLQSAYAAAAVFCFPSLWEGFGMPVLEAMNHGTPVVTSRGTSMAEVSGDGALLVDPLDTAQIAAAVREAAGEQGASLGAAGRVNAARYTWEASAAAHVEVYREAVARGASRPSGRRP